MKTCNNCGTINEEGVRKCTHCNMEGNFTGIAASHKPSQPSSEKRVCNNCGTDSPGNGAVCVQCNFPLPVTSANGKLMPKISVVSNLKAG